MGLGGFGGAGPEGPPNVTEGAGQAPPPTGCLRPYSFLSILVLVPNQRANEKKALGRSKPHAHGTPGDRGPSNWPQAAATVSCAEECAGRGVPLRPHCTEAHAKHERPAG